MKTHTQSITSGPHTVDVTLTEQGDGRPFLLLHGGAGPFSVAGFATLLATRAPCRVLTPTHPGFGGTPRPATLDSVRALAAVYVELLAKLDLRDVTVVGNSVGGWIAAEMALLEAGRDGIARIARVVLVDAAGIDVPGHPVADVFSLELGELMKLSYYNPAPFAIDPKTFTDAQRAAAGANRAALRVYGGEPSMVDPTLRARLAGVTVPTLVVWGEADRVVDTTYGRAYADAIPNAKLEILTETGHVPQIETPEKLYASIASFATA